MRLRIVLRLTMNRPKLANVVLWCQHTRCTQQYNLDLNHDGIADVTIWVVWHPESVCSWYDAVFEEPASGNGAIGSGYYAAALMQGAQIGHGQSFYGGTGVMAEDQGFNCRHNYGGPWYSVRFPVTAYLGLRFQLNGRNHYGWAKLTVEGVTYAKLTGYAYETIAGKSIKAGQKEEAADEVGEEDFGSGASLTSPIPNMPQPATLGMLARGTQCVPLWRRKESAVEGDFKGALL